MRIFKIILLILFPFISSAQVSSEQAMGKVRIGITPTSYINIIYGPQISLDYSLNKRFNLTLEGAYLHGFYNRPAQGFKIKMGIEEICCIKSNTGFVKGIHFIYRNAAEFPETWELKGGNQYLERIENYKRNRNLAAGYLYSGYIIKRGKVTFELGFGIGIGRFNTYDNSDLDNSQYVSEINDPRFIFQNDVGVWIPYLTYPHLNISYILK